METKQPAWKFIANLGDASPLEHGGFFVYQDETGVYAPEARYLEPNDSTWERVNHCMDCEGMEAPCSKHAKLEYALEYRFSLDRCTLTEGILSDNPYHPLHPAWWASPESEKVNRPQDTTYLSTIADTTGEALEDLQEAFCSEDLIERAQAYKSVGEVHGWENLDSYPLTWTVAEYAELKARYEVSK